MREKFLCFLMWLLILTVILFNTLLGVLLYEIIMSGGILNYIDKMYSTLLGITYQIWLITSVGLLG